LTSGEILDYGAFRDAFARWYLKNCRTEYVLDGYTADDYVEMFKMPDFRYVYAGSYVDENGDIISKFRCVFHLDATESRSCKPVDLVFYKLVRAYPMTPDVTPDEAGFIFE
jgi:hypothetical protein